MRFERRSKIETLRQKLRIVSDSPATAQSRAFLMAEIAKLQQELNELARGSKAQILAGWGH